MPLELLPGQGSIIISLISIDQALEVKEGKNSLFGRNGFREKKTLGQTIELPYDGQLGPRGPGDATYSTYID